MCDMVLQKRPLRPRDLLIFRWSFEQTTATSPYPVHFYRMLTALGAYLWTDCEYNWNSIEPESRK